MDAKELPDTARAAFLRNLLYRQRPDGSFEGTPIVVAPGISKEEIESEVKSEVESRVVSLRQRLDAIEQRFPSQDSVDKIASVNDAILATNLESLAEAVSKLESKLLTKWDVAKIVFQIIAALGALVGLSLKYSASETVAVSY